jgi:hypothetical protein
MYYCNTLYMCIYLYPYNVLSISMYRLCVLHKKSGPLISKLTWTYQHDVKLSKDICAYMAINIYYQVILLAGLYLNLGSENFAWPNQNFSLSSCERKLIPILLTTTVSVASSYRGRSHVRLF